MVEIAGPEWVGLSGLVQRYLTTMGDPRTVVANAKAPYFGLQLDDGSLTPGDKPTLGNTTFENWLAKR